MTEQQWLKGVSPTPKLKYLRRNRTSDRKVRLFVVACCRRIYSLLPDDVFRQAVEVGERFADGLADVAELKSIQPVAQCADMLHNRGENASVGSCAAFASIYCVAGKLGRSEACTGWASAAVSWAESGIRSSSENLKGTAARTSEELAQAHLLRDIFGNPFRPVAFDPAWRTDTAVSLARQMYESREFSAMPILADALQDAGCDNPDVLNHCRGEGPHVRGCWVVDLVLGKE